MSILDTWRHWLNTPQHMTVDEWRRLRVGTLEAFGTTFTQTPDSVHRLAARLEAEQAMTFGGRPCPEQLPHGHGRSGECRFTDACPSCGAAL